MTFKHAQDLAAGYVPDPSGRVVTASEYLFPVWRPRHDRRCFWLDTQNINSGAIQVLSADAPTAVLCVAPGQPTEHH
jgi:hypothetical protein